MELSGIQLIFLLIAVGTVAFLYSSVGHGGATGYLAIMSLLGVPAIQARPGALWMNCVVATIAFWRFRNAGYFHGRLFAALAVASVPMAWLGSRLPLHGAVYAIVLGLGLASSGWLLGWRRHSQDERPQREFDLFQALLVGGCPGGLGRYDGHRRRSVSDTAIDFPAVDTR